MTVLIATPARLSTPKPLMDRSAVLQRRLSYMGSMERALYLNTQPATLAVQGKFLPNARARNELLERFLRPYHEWVLWIDADIIEYPANMLRVLMGISEANDRAIVAPMVWVERVVEDAPPDIPVGGWFYDTGGFVRDDGTYADFVTGVEGDGDEIEMLSVGCVYLAPADIYRRGVRYEPVGNEVEHLSAMRQARALGTKVLATKKINVIHAYLPRWGEAWTHEAVV